MHLAPGSKNCSPRAKRCGSSPTSSMTGLPGSANTSTLRVDGSASFMSESVHVYVTV